MRTGRLGRGIGLPEPKGARDSSSERVKDDARLRRFKRRFLNMRDRRFSLNVKDLDGLHDRGYIGSFGRLRSGGGEKGGARLLMVSARA